MFVDVHFHYRVFIFCYLLIIFILSLVLICVLMNVLYNCNARICIFIVRENYFYSINL